MLTVQRIISFIHWTLTVIINTRSHQPLPSPTLSAGLSDHTWPAMQSSHSLIAEHRPGQSPHIYIVTSGKISSKKYLHQLQVVLYSFQLMISAGWSFPEQQCWWFCVSVYYYSVPGSLLDTFPEINKVKVQLTEQSLWELKLEISPPLHRTPGRPSIARGDLWLS